MSKIEGGCLCGAVTYHSECEPHATVVCHCRDCQKHSGAACSINIMLPREGFSVNGEVSSYAGCGDSGHEVRRYFCKTCGSLLYNMPALISDMCVLKAGTLNDPSWVKPTMEIYCDSAQDWAKLGGEVSSLPGMIPSQ